MGAVPFAMGQCTSGSEKPISKNKTGSRARNESVTKDKNASSSVLQADLDRVARETNEEANDPRSDVRPSDPVPLGQTHFMEAGHQTALNKTQSGTNVVPKGSFAQLPMPANMNGAGRPSGGTDAAPGSPHGSFAQLPGLPQSNGAAEPKEVDAPEPVPLGQTHFMEVGHEGTNVAALTKTQSGTNVALNIRGEVPKGSYAQLPMPASMNASGKPSGGRPSVV